MSTQAYGHPAGCHCYPCTNAKTQMLIADLQRYGLKPLAQIIAEHNKFTDEQRSLAWSPEPPYESIGAGDGRFGGSAGFDLEHETRRSKWIQARFRYRREQKQVSR